MNRLGMVIIALVFQTLQLFSQSALVDENGVLVNDFQPLMETTLSSVFLEALSGDQCGDFFVGVYASGGFEIAIQTRGKSGGFHIQSFRRERFVFLIDSTVTRPMAKFVIDPLTSEINRVIVKLTRQIYRDALCLPEREDVQRF